MTALPHITFGESACEKVSLMHRTSKIYNIVLTGELDKAGAQDKDKSAL